jgi:hypothetical protein
MTNQDTALDPLPHDYPSSFDAASPLDLPEAQVTSDLVLAQLEAWLDAILVERAARDARD